MEKSRLDISNAAISIFLHDVGAFYDRARGFVAFGPTVEQTAEVLAHFSYECTYCRRTISAETVSWDYLIPVDKTALGLHAWGNVVPCCSPCCSIRQQKTWREFLHLRCDVEVLRYRETFIETFASGKRYDLNLNLRVYADTLYEDIGVIATTLIQLRYKQAEQKLRAILSEEPHQRTLTDRRANREKR